MNPLKRLRANRRGSMAGGIIALVVGLAVVVVSVMVLLVISGQMAVFSNALNYPSYTWNGTALVPSTTGNSTAASLFTNTFSSISLLTILPIIMVAGILIAAVGGFLMWYKGR